MIAFLLRLFTGDLDEGVRAAVALLAILSMLGGNLLALRQTNAKRMLAYPSSGEIAAAAAGQQMGTLGAETTRRNLNVQPTIKIPPGYRFNVRVNRDLAFEGPYRPTPDGASGPAFP